MEKIILCLSLLFALNSRAQDSTMKSANLEEVLIENYLSPFNVEGKRYLPQSQSSVEELVEAIPGVSLIRRGNFAQEPAIRGLNGAQINMSIDGMPLFSACTDRMDPVSSYLEPNNLRSIEVGFSADAPSFGSSIGGGFDFKTQQAQVGNPQPWAGKAGFAYESNGNGLQGLGALTYSGRRLAVNMNGIMRRSGNYFAGGRQEIEFSQYQKWNGSLSGKYLLGKNHILAMQYLQDEAFDVGYPALTMDVLYAKAKIGSLTHTYLPTNGRMEKWETKAYVNAIDHAMDDTKRPEEMIPIHMDMPGTSQTFGLYSEASWAWGNKNHLQFRVDAYDNRLHAEMTMYPKTGSEMFMLTIPDAERIVAGINGSNHYLVSDDLSILLGVRMEYNSSSIYSSLGKKTLSGLHDGELDREKLITNFYLNPEWKLGKNWRLLGHFARGMRAASLKELYGFYLFNRADNYDYLGNPNLKDEKSWNFSLNAKYRSGKLAVEAKAFAYLFEDFIAGTHAPQLDVMTTIASGVKRYANLERARLYGAELTIRATPLDFLYFQSDNAFTYGRDHADRPLPLIPPFSSRTQVGMQLKEMKFVLEGLANLAQNEVDVQFYGERPSPGFAIANLSFEKKFRLKSSNFVLNLRLDNVFDTEYYEHLDLMKVPRMGRNLVIQTIWYF